MAAKKRGRPAKRKRSGAAKHVADWDSIRREYDEGALSLEMIAENHGLSSHRAITMRAQREGWPKREGSGLDSKELAIAADQSEAGEPIVIPAGMRNRMISFHRAMEYLLKNRKTIRELQTIVGTLTLHVVKHIQDAEKRPGDRRTGEGAGRLRLDEIRLVTSSTKDLITSQEKLDAMLRRSFGFKDHEAPSEFDGMTIEEQSAVVDLIRQALGR